MIGECFRRHKPGYGGQASFFHIFPELVQHIALRDIHLPFYVSVLVGIVGQLMIGRIVLIGGEGFFVQVLFPLAQLLIILQRISFTLLLQDLKEFLLLSQLFADAISCLAGGWQRL